MKNPYLRFVIIISLLISFLYVLCSVSEIIISSNASFELSTKVLSNGVVDNVLVSNMSSISKLVSSIGMLASFIPMFIGYSILSFLSGDGEGAGLLMGIIMEFIGPILVFICWFVILYLITYFYYKLVKSKRENNENSPVENNKTISKKFILISLTIVILFNITNFSYLWFQELKTFNDRAGHPITITSVKPNLAKIGETITINGNGFLGQELIVWLADKTNNKYGMFWMGEPTNDTTIIFKIPSVLCAVAVQTNCEHPVTFKPGKYLIEIRGGSSYPSQAFELL